MYTVNDIASYIEKLAPTYLACEWDNVGLIVGNKSNIISKILVTLDVDINVVNEAVKNGCNLIVSHHPLMFHPIKRLNEDNSCEKVLMELVKNNISLYSAHTNLDVAPGGLNDRIASKLGMEDTQILEITGEYNGKECGFGRYATLKTPKKFSEILAICKKVFSLKSIKYCGDINKKIKTIAINCGGGSSSLSECYKYDIDVFISGDFKYNTFRDAYENGVSVIDVGHYNSEFIVMDLFYEYLSNKFDDIEIIKSQKNVDIVSIYE